MSLILVSPVMHSPVGTQGTVGALAGEPQVADALIAEAHAHARRRRLKIAVTLIVLAVTAGAAVLIGRAVVSHGTARTHPPRVVPADATGLVTGHLAACFGIPPKSPAQVITPGTVVALRGRVTYKQVMPGSWIAQFPKGPVAASQHISDNYDQEFRFALPPGHYVIAGHYDEDRAGSYRSFREVTVTANATMRVELPNLCP